MWGIEGQGLRSIVRDRDLIHQIGLFTSKQTNVGDFDQFVSNVVSKAGFNGIVQWYCLLGKQANVGDSRGCFSLNTGEIGLFTCKQALFTCKQAYLGDSRGLF